MGSTFSNLLEQILLLFSHLLFLLMVLMLIKLCLNSNLYLVFVVFSDLRPMILMYSFLSPVDISLNIFNIPSFNCFKDFIIFGLLDLDLSKTLLFVRRVIFR